MSGPLFLRRPRVDTLLLADCPLLLLIAPAGYGKTCAMRQAVALSSAKCGWVTLTGGDTEIFWEKCCNAVASFSVQAAKALTSLGPPADMRQMERAAYILARCGTTLARKGCPRVQLVFDDFHHLCHNKLLCHMFSILALEEPIGLRIVLISREEPLLPLTTLRLKGLCSFVGMGDIAFQKEEIAAFLKLRGFSTDDSLTRRIWQVSGGWISALRLMRPLQEPDIPVGDIFALLRENLLDTLSEEERDILYRCSLLEVFTPEQAAAVLEAPRAEILLEYLLQKNAFLSRDEQGLCRFHPLLQEVLTHECTRLKLDVHQTLYRAAHWLCAHGQTRESFIYFLKSGKIEEFLQRIDGPSGRNLPYNSIKGIRQMVSSLPSETLCRYPFTMLYVIFYLLLTGIPEECARAAQLLTLLRGSSAVNTHPEQERLCGECCLLDYFFTQGDAPAWGHLKRAAALLHGQPSLLLYQEDPFTMGLPGLLYQDYHSAGSLEDTIIGSQYHLFDALCPGFGCGADTLLAAEAALQRGDMDRANTLAITAAGQAKQRQQWVLVSGAYFVQARRALFLNDIAGMHHFLHEQRALEGEIRSTQHAPFNWRLFMDVTDLCSAWCGTEGAKAVSLPESLRDTKHEWMLGGRGWPCLIRARAAFQMQKWLELRTLAEESLCLCLGKYQLGVLHARILLAVALFQTEELNLGLASLEKALWEAAMDNVLLPFSAYADEILPLLEQLSHVYVKNAFTEQVRLYCLQQREKGRFIDIHKQLTVREQDVLRLTGCGLIRREVAKKLHIQEDTVHKHLWSIYRKLGVGNKLAAVHAARQQGILPQTETFSLPSSDPATKKWTSS